LNVDSTLQGPDRHSLYLAHGLNLVKMHAVSFPFLTVEIKIMSKRRKRRSSPFKEFLPAIILFVMIVIVVVIGVLSFVLGPAAGSLNAARSAGNDFMTALQNADYKAAYGMISPAYQAVFGGDSGGADVMQSEFANAGWEPSNFSLTQTQVAPSGKTVVTGTGTFGGATKYFSIYLQKIGGTWEVMGYMTEENPPTSMPNA
jgi:hypothetical protein